MGWVTAFLEVFRPIMNWWNKKEAVKDGAAQDMKDDLQAHAGDGQASVSGRESYQQQRDALLRQAEEAEKEHADEISTT